jgi:fructose-specific phosphotransferase system IIA component
MDLKELLSSDQIIYDLKAHTKNEIINELVKVLAKCAMVSDRHLALNNVLEREKLLSTGMELGLAIPHAKTDAVDDLVVAFGLHKQGVDFESIDGQPAHFIFLVLSPHDTSGPHIKALAQISRWIKKGSVRDDLIKAGSVEEIEKILTQTH